MSSIPGSPAPSRSSTLVHRYGAPAGVFVIGLAIYLRTLMPGQAFDDWGELQTVPHLLGIPHPTGYPTYVLAAHLFELLPLGSVAFRANLMAAVCVALALATIVSICQRLGVRPLLAAGAALATGAVGTIWAAAVVAEVNSLHVLFIALILDRSLAWADSQRLRDLALGGLLIGLSLGNHVLTAFVAPYAILFVLWTGRRTLLAHKAWILAPLATMALGLSVYLYLPIAASQHPALPYNTPVTWDGFVFLVTGEQFRGQYDGLFTSGGVSVFLRSIPDLVRLLVDRGSAVLPLLGVVGLVVAARRRPAFALVLAATLVTGGYIWANYLRLEHYLLVPWLVIGILAGVGLDGLADALARLLPERQSRVAGPAVAIGAGVLALALIVTNLSDADRSSDRTAETYVNGLLAQLPQGAAIVTPWGPSTPLWYATLVDHKRPDVLVVDDTNIVYEGWGSREKRIASLICSRPVYTLRLDARDLDPLRAQYRLTKIADFFVGGGTPWATAYEPLYRVERPASCP